ncbi:peptidase serine carboxypeptidase protein [Rutstroemia sp. NJR-2017a WRK4]|nr:peptidase serine carboxypeptidase protein [Rutstroemia sp. NJR-2017a WRK4]
MFHYLRPHRRTPSTPSSPNPEQHSFEGPLHSVDHGHPARFYGKGDEKPSGAATPPLLPPISRVSSGYAKSFENLTLNSKSTTHGHDTRGQAWDGTKPNNGQRDADQRLQSYTGSQRSDPAENAGPGSSKQTSYDNMKSQSNSSQESNMKSRRPDSRFFGSQSEQESKANGRRQAGARLPSPTQNQSTSSSEQPAPPQSGKTRLKMLNPMALLARRRTSQAIPQLAPESLISNLSSNDSFDPRIKGTVIHDFSAPRPRRNMSYNDVKSAEVSKTFQRSPLPEPPTTDDATRPAGNHTPVFTENFEEEQYPLAGPHVRAANDLSDLTLPKLPYAKDAQRSLEPHSSSNSNVESQAQTSDSRRMSAEKSPSDFGPPVPAKPQGTPPSEPRRISIDPASTPPKAYPSSRKGRSRNVSEVSAKDLAGLPRHMKSTSSRFSFDMMGAAEQERLLEDRHRQKALAKKNDPDGDDEQQVYDEDDDFNYDDMMDDDGFEERIPGVNADYDDDGFGGFDEEMPAMNNTTLEEIEEAEEHQEAEEAVPVREAKDQGLLDGNVTAFSFQPYAMPSPMSPYTPGTATTPRDSNGEVIGFALTKNSPFLTTDPPQSVFTPVSPAPNLSPEYDQLHEPQTIQDLKLESLGVDAETLHEPTPEPNNQLPVPTSFPHIPGLDDDDLYFDDGMIGLEDGGEPSNFDESVFDNNDTDQYGRPLQQFSLAQLNAKPPITAEKLNTVTETLSTVEQSPTSLTSDKPLGRLAPQPSFSENTSGVAEVAAPVIPAPQVTHGLTQDTLAAYQSALAAAAMSAAANGKFRRDSTQSLFPPASEAEGTQPGMIEDSGHASTHYDHLSPSYDDDFDYDDALEDDEFIAAANAEALANDQDGFYGQEFGFYSQPAASSAEYANGGYFGPRGMEGINRSQSGRVVSREPNLTPITERSEYSNRNSFMSQVHGQHSASVVGSPGLAQLMIAQDYGGPSDMTLEALLKLRSRAWGGSQASLKSAGSAGNASPGSVDGGSGSPVAAGFNAPPWGGVLGAGAHRRKGSAFSLVSEEVEGEVDDEVASPVVNGGTSRSSPEVPKKDTEVKSPREAENGLPNPKQHKYTGSSESISYSKEEDPVRGERWVLERRRTAESGEVELLGREVLSGGAI